MSRGSSAAPLPMKSLRTSPSELRRCAVVNMSVVSFLLIGGTFELSRSRKQRTASRQHQLSVTKSSYRSKSPCLGYRYEKSRIFQLLSTHRRAPSRYLPRRPRMSMEPYEYATSNMSRTMKTKRAVGKSSIMLSSRATFSGVLSPQRLRLGLPTWVA